VIIVKKYSLGIVTGNHRSLWGISDILKCFDFALNTQVPRFFFPQKQWVNFIIEDFYNKRYLNALVETDTTNVLVVTEFLSIKRNSIAINQFPPKISTFVFPGLWRFLKYFLKANLRSVKYFFSFQSVDRYWKNRKKGINTYFDKRPIDPIIQLHPACTLHLDLGNRKVFDFFPIVDEHSLTKIAKNPDIVFVTFGTMNSYRAREIRKFNRFVPQGILHISEEALAKSPKNFKNKILIDVYFRNSESWPYLSPLRFWRSLSNNRIVLYVGKINDDHPINSLCINVGDYNEIYQVLENLNSYIDSSREKIKDYNILARAKNGLIEDYLSAVNS
jgi:hypothetical protein